MILNTPKSFFAFVKGYWYIVKHLFLKAIFLFVRHTGKVETCYGGVQSTLFGTVTFISYSKHQLNNLSDHLEEKIEKIQKK